MIIVVPSVHHTGTKFVYRYLLSDEKGWEFVVPNPDTKSAYLNADGTPRKGNKGKVRIHIDKPLMPRVHAWMKEFPSIVPLRHPRAVAQSWKNKQKDLRWLGEQWEFLKREVDSYDPYYLPLNDSELRNDYLNDINNELDIDVDYNWPVICKGADEFKELTNQDEELIYSWMFDGFFEKFGYSYENH